MSGEGLAALYERLRGPERKQVWHEADVDGYHLYMADTSFGYGPIFHCSGHGVHHSYGCETGEWLPLTKGTALSDLEWILPLCDKAEWVDQLERDERAMGYRP